MKQLTVICLLTLTLILSGCGGGAVPVAPIESPQVNAIAATDVIFLIIWSIIFSIGWTIIVLTYWTIYKKFIGLLGGVIWGAVIGLISGLIGGVCSSVTVIALLALHARNG